MNEHMQGLLLANLVMIMRLLDDLGKAVQNSTSEDGSLSPDQVELLRNNIAVVVDLVDTIGATASSSASPEVNRIFIDEVNRIVGLLQDSAQLNAKFNEIVAGLDKTD